MYKIEIPTGHRIAEVNKETGEVTFEKIQPQYPTSIGQLRATGWFVTSNGNISCYKEDHVLRSDNQNCLHHLPTESLAKAFKALMQLVALRDEYNRIDGFVADWTDGSQCKFTIYGYKNIIDIGETGFYHEILHFISPATRDLFLTNFRGLIEEAKELL